ncbi:MAG: polysaccharide biosynthesis/export family protein [Candidatus Poribacteria bacterium]|nr:polysaccharide biosynthesis/export family protein [Candidatus Poribacteria bacterium]
MNTFLRLRFLFLSLIILGFQSFSPFVFAEETSDENIVTKSPQFPETSTYKLQIGDSIVVTVEGYPEYTKDRVPIPIQPDGYISYPLIGLIKATGVTVSELEAQMQRVFAKKLPSARVFVTLMQPKRHILVFGAVDQRPRGNMHIFETGQVYLMHALAAAGINYELADLTKITVWRNGEIFKTVNFEEHIQTGGVDIPLKDYDIVIVPSIYAQRRIRVIGAVITPGFYPITNNQIPADQALKLAGGSRADFADLKKAEIITGPENTPIDLTSENVSAMLKPGDVLFIPLAEAKISVVGAVDEPSQYVITEPILLRDAVAMAGGLDEEKANPKKCILTRADGTQEELDFNLVQSEIYLHPNDQLRILERTRIDWRVLSFAASLTNLVVSVWLRYR